MAEPFPPVVGNGFRPDIFETVLDGRQPAELTMASLMKALPVVWEEQRQALGLTDQPLRAGAKWAGHRKNPDRGASLILARQPFPITLRLG